MPYGFHFELSGGIIYYEGCEKEEEARTKLERIARGHCENDSLGSGKVFRIENGEREILSSYNYSFNQRLVIVESD